MISPYELQARLLKSLAHPTRLKMIEDLAAGDKCVTDLQASVGDHISTISKHLAVLRAAGIVDTRKQGLQVFYRLRAPCVSSFLNCLQAAADPNRPDDQKRTITLCIETPAKLNRRAQ
jgi:ArsR family transcriptional regulator